MGKYDTWSITCKLCDWQWETCSQIMAQKPKCKICGSTDCIVEKNDLITIKKQGKIITDIGFDPMHFVSEKMSKDVVENTTFLNRPLLVIRENDCKFNKELTTDDLRQLIRKMDLIKTKIIRDIKEDDESSNSE